MAGSSSPSGYESLSRTLYEPLIPPLLAGISGILFVNALGMDFRIALLCAAASALLWLLARQLHLPRAAFLSGNAFLFWLAAASTSHSEAKPQPAIDTAANEIVSLEGCVDSLPQREADRLFFHFAAAPGARLRVSFYLKPGEATPAWSYGDRLELPLRIRPIRNAGNPGNFDAQRYFAHRDIYWSASVARGYPIVQVPHACGNSFQSSIYRIRSWLLDRIHDITAGDHYLDAMLAALLLGDNARLEESYTDNYRRTGTYHAIVISGMHITVLAGALYLLLRALLLQPRHCYVVCAIVAVLYALICDLSAPVVRAAGGYLLFLGAKLCYRRGRTLNLLAAIALLYLLIDPAQLFEASFQLSFLAVLTLAALGDPLLQHTTGPWIRALRFLDDPESGPSDAVAGPRRLELELAADTLSRLLAIPKRWIVRSFVWTLVPLLRAIELFLTSGVILIGLCLPMILFFHRLTFSSLTANLPVVFLLSLAVPLGFAAILTGPALTPLLRWLLLTSREVVDWHLTWDQPSRIPDPPAWILLAFPLALLLTAWSARKFPRFTLVPLSAVALLFAYIILQPYTAHPDLKPGLLELTSIDVGQGDSLFIATPQGHLALLDGGGNRFSRFDPGESTISPYLWSRHIARIDTIIASHGDLDHMGGLLAAYDNFRPREIWVSSQVSGALWQSFRARATGTRIRYLSRGDTLKLGELDVVTLWPPRDEPIPQSNLTSLVLLVTHGSRRFLLTGDIDQSVEARLLEDPRLEKIDYLKLAHHGSKSSTSAEFLQLARPSVAVASSGFRNSFNHPHPDVIERLSQSHTLLLRTDLMGQISVFSDGFRLSADPFLYRAPQSSRWIPFAQALE